MRGAGSGVGTEAGSHSTLRHRLSQGPITVSVATQLTLLELFQHLQVLLRQHNRWVQDPIMACEVPADEVKHLRLVISADAHPAGEHARRYNRPEGLQEVSVLIGEEPAHQDLILRRRAAGAQWAILLF